MAAVIPAIAGAAASHFIGAAVGGGILGSIIGGVSGALVSSLASGVLGLNKQENTPQFAQSSRGAAINTASTVDPIPVIYGTRRWGGTRIFAETYGTNNIYLHLAFCICEGEISAIANTYLDDVLLGNSRWASHYGYNEAVVGTDSQTAFPQMSTLLPAKWTGFHNIRGCAGYALQLIWQPGGPYEQSGVPTLSFDVNGKLVYDPRDSTTKFSNNPALCIRDYLTNTRYGRGIASSAIDDDTFSDAADYCDQSVSIPASGGGTTTQARYTCDAVINPEDGHLDNLRKLLTTCRGSLVFSGGKYKLVLDAVAAGSPPESFAFTEDNIVGEWSIKLPGKRDRFNRVRARFVNPDRSWQPDIAVVDSSTYRTEDNGILLEREIELPFTTDYYTAAQIAQVELKQSRIGMVAQFRATIAALACEVGDVVSITHATPGWDGKLFRVINLELLPDDEIKVTAREYDEAVYTLDDLDLADAAPSTSLPDPFADLTVTLGTPVSGTSELFVAGDGTVVPRIRLPFTPPGNPFVKRYEAQFARSAGSPQDWQNAPDPAASATEALVYPVEDGVAYDLRVRAVTSLGNAGPWAYAYAHTVAGKTALPSDVTGFSAVQQSGLVLFDTDTVSDADLDLIEIRLGDAGNANWDDATPLTNILRGQTATSAAVIPGSWTFLAKARDTSGNYSAAAARIDLTVTAEGFTAIASEEQAPKWLGARTNLVKHWTGKLFPDSQDAASDDTWDTFDIFVPNPYADCYYEAPVVDKGIDAPARIYADIVSVLGPGEAGTAAPKLEVDTWLAAGAFSAFVPWTVGVESFRYAAARIYVDTAIGVPVISGFDVIIDAASRREEFPAQTIGSSGTAITFAQPFHATPVIQITPIGATALIPSAESPSATGFTAHLYNTGGSGAAGSADIVATGA